MAVPLNAADGQFNSGVESVSAALDTSTLSEGRHILFVRGQDSAGTWGAISAIFLYIDNNAPTPTPTPLPPVTIFSDDFESDLGWTINPNGADTATTGQWARANPEGTDSGGPLQLGTTVSGSQDLVTGPLAGSSVGTHDIDSGVTSIRSPLINLPSSGDLELSFYYYLAHLNNATEVDFLRVQIVGSTTTTIFEELGAANNDSAAWVQFSTDISSFAGESIYLLVSAADSGSASLVEAALDDVLITQANAGPTVTPTHTPLPTSTPLPTATQTPQPTATATPTNTAVPTNTPTVAPSATPLPTTEATQTPLPTATNTPLPTATATATLSPTATPLPPTATATPQPTATSTPLPPVSEIIYMSSSSGGSVNGVSYNDEDILAYDVTAGSWSIFLDGSDVGLGASGAADIDAFALLDDGSILFSIVASTTLQDIGTVDDSDIVRFVPTSLGNNTAGSFELYFDGSDVGLTTNGEDIDGVALLPDGRLLISVSGSFSVPGVSGRDEDIILFELTQSGPNTVGSWAPYFDGSDVGLSNSSDEDVWGIDVAGATGNLLLTTRGTFSVSGLSGSGEDIFGCEPITLGSSTACNFATTLILDGSAVGLAGERLDGIHRSGD